MSDARVRQVLARAGRELAAMKDQLAWLLAYRHLEAADLVADRAQYLTVRMERVRCAWRARKARRG